MGLGKLVLALSLVVPTVGSGARTPVDMSDPTYLFSKGVSKRITVSVQPEELGHRVVSPSMEILDANGDNRTVQQAVIDFWYQGNYVMWALIAPGYEPQDQFGCEPKCVFELSEKESRELNRAYRGEGRTLHGFLQKELERDKK